MRSKIIDTDLADFPKSVKKKLAGSEAIEINYLDFDKKHYLIFPSFKMKQSWVTAIRKIQGNQITKRKVKKTGGK